MRRLLLLVMLASAALHPAWAESGIVVRLDDGVPIRGASVSAGHTEVKTDAAGRFQLPPGAGTLNVRAPGYRRVTQSVVPGEFGAVRIALRPFEPRAAYLSFYGIGSATLREAALALIEHTELNALVIDVKGDRGMIPYSSAVTLASAVGAQAIRTVHDMPGLIAVLHAKDIYLIARIVVFKDDPLATARPELALKNSSGEIWRDREGLAWTDPASPDVWRYNLDVAEEAARMGFDEIQFDYVRFPDAEGVHYTQANVPAYRVGAVTTFLTEARARLTPYNVFIAADIFGYVLWNLDDTAIGQQLEQLVQPLDIICPMLYPSGFKWGIPGFRHPLEHPYEIVFRSLMHAQERTGLGGVRFRPWLQDFPDYAFDRRRFGAHERRAQIDAARDAKSNGWMLWNPRNQYARDGLDCAGAACVP